MDAKTKPVRLRTLLADYPHTAALKRGEVTSSASRSTSPT
jgi:hypothetical protein